MTRRLMLATLAAAAFDPERALWKPGEKVISIPAPPPIEPCPYWIKVGGYYEHPFTDYLNAVLAHKWETSATFRSRCCYETVECLVAEAVYDVFGFKPS